MFPNWNINYNSVLLDYVCATKDLDNETEKPGVNFTNVLCAAFTLIGPKKHKNVKLSPQYLFMLSGSEHIKAVPRKLMKLSPGERNMCFCMYSMCVFECMW